MGDIPICVACAKPYTKGHHPKQIKCKKCRLRKPRKCAGCRGDFYPRRKGHIFCAPKCKDRAKRPCRYCGKTFLPVARVPNKIYCTSNCAKTDHKKGRVRPSRAKPKTYAVCANCGETFHQKRANHIYCMTRCYNQSNPDNHRSCVVCANRYSVKNCRRKKTCCLGCEKTEKVRRKRGRPVENGALPCTECGVLVPRRTMKGPRPQSCPGECNRKAQNRTAHRWCIKNPEKAAATRARHKNMRVYVQSLGIDPSSLTTRDRSILREAKKIGGRYRRQVETRLLNRLRIRPLFHLVQRTDKSVKRKFWIDLLELCHQIYGTTGLSSIVISPAEWCRVTYADKNATMDAQERAWERWKKRMRIFGLIKNVESDASYKQHDTLLDLQTSVPLADMVLGIDSDDLDE